MFASRATAGLHQLHYWHCHNTEADHHVPDSEALDQGSWHVHTWEGPWKELNHVCAHFDLDRKETATKTAPSGNQGLPVQLEPADLSMSGHTPPPPSSWSRRLPPFPEDTEKETLRVDLHVRLCLQQHSPLYNMLIIVLMNIRCIVVPVYVNNNCVCGHCTVHAALSAYCTSG